MKSKLEELGYEPLFENENNDPNIFLNLSQNIGYSIPEDYQQFLMDYPSTGTFSVLVETPVIDRIPAAGDYEYLPISILFAGCVSKPNYHLLHEREFDVIPPHFILIGEDIGGNGFIISLNDSTFGRIYYFDHEEYFYDKETGSLERIYLVANDFTTFICNLRVSPDQ